MIPGDPNSFGGASEHSQQVALFAALAQYENHFRLTGDERMANAIRWVHAIPNGGSRGSDKRSAMIAGANMKAEGVKTGVSDIDVVAACHGYHGFKIELKAPGKLKGESKEQKAYGAWLAQCGYLYAVFDSWQDALKAIKWYLGIEAHPFEWALP